MEGKPPGPLATRPALDVILGLDPRIHSHPHRRWMLGSSPSMTKERVQDEGRDDERVIRTRDADSQPHFPSRISESVRVGVIASGSSFTSMIAGLPLARALRKAAAKSSVFSTVSPWPP